MSRWWRAYDEAVDDPKLILLSDKMHRAWFNVLCVASANGGILPDVSIIAVKLRTTPTKVMGILTTLRAVELLDEVDGRLRPHNWDSRQYKSDVTDPTAANRMRNYRNRRRNATVTVTPPRDRVQKTDTEADSERGDTALRADPPARARGTRLSADWCPSVRNVDYAISKGFDIARVGVIAEKFRNHWTSKAGKDACKVDWDRTWENWILNETERRHGPQSRQQCPPNGGDLARELAAEVREREREAGLFGPPDAVGSH